MRFARELLIAVAGAFIAGLVTALATTLPAAVVAGVGVGACILLLGALTAGSWLLRKWRQRRAARLEKLKAEIVAEVLQSNKVPAIDTSSLKGEITSEVLAKIDVPAIDAARLKREIVSDVLATLKESGSVPISDISGNALAVAESELRIALRDGGNLQADLLKSDGGDDISGGMAALISAWMAQARAAIAAESPALLPDVRRIMNGEDLVSMSGGRAYLLMDLYMTELETALSRKMI